MVGGTKGLSGPDAGIFMNSMTMLRCARSIRTRSFKVFCKGGARFDNLAASAMARSMARTPLTKSIRSCDLADRMRSVELINSS